jgi:hypothetical protein
MENILDLFHHIHHLKNKHEVHHCGGKHKGLDYTIKHCKCGKHQIDKQIAVGHNSNNKPVKIKFSEKCPFGGWHIESGKYC